MKAQKFIEGLRYITDNINKANYSFEHASSHKYECEIISWNQQAFRGLYEEIINIKMIKEQFQQLINLPSEMAGKKLSMIQFSSQRKFCIKLITKQDYQKFQDSFKEYINFKKKTQNCLIDIYRLFMVRSIDSHGIQSQDYWVVMPCLVKPLQSHICSYDIKGHCDNRVISETDYLDFNYGKDQNFLKSQHLQMIKKSLSSEQKRDIIDVIETSCNFLAKLDIIDYSLFLQIYKSQQEEQTKPFKSAQLTQKIRLQWAIIDIFQVYNTKKKIQNRFKSMFYKDISSVEPQPYMKRLIDFLNKYFF